MRAPYSRRPVVPVTEQLDVQPTNTPERVVNTETLIYSDDFRRRLAIAREKRARVLSARNAPAATSDMSDLVDAGPKAVEYATPEAAEFEAGVEAGFEPAPQVEFSHRPYRRSFEPLADVAPSRDAGRSFGVLPTNTLVYPQGFGAKAARLRKSVVRRSEAGGKAVANSLASVGAKAGGVLSAVPSAGAIRAASKHTIARTRSGLGTAVQKTTQSLPSGHAIFGGAASGLGQLRGGAAHMAGRVGASLSGAGQSAASMSKAAAGSWASIMAPNLPYRAASVAACGLIGLGILVWHFPVPSSQPLSEQQASAVIGTINATDVSTAQLNAAERSAPRLASTPRVVISRDQRTPVLPGADVASGAAVELENQLERAAEAQVGPFAVGSPAALNAWVPAPEFAGQTSQAVSIVTRSQFEPGALPNSTVVSDETPRLMSPDARPIFKSLRPTQRPVRN